MATQMMIAPPVFLGDRMSNGNLRPGSASAEDWITRVDNLQRSNNWTDEQAAGQARGFLHEEAAEWFNYTMKVQDKALHARMLVSYLAIKEAFRKRFFTIQSTIDVTTDWAHLKQLTHEGARAFVDRVLATIMRYAEMFPLNALSATHVTEMQAAIALIINPDVTNAQRAAWNTSITRIVAGHTRESYESLLIDMSFKIIAQGLKKPKLAEIVRQEARKGSTVDQMAIAVSNAMKLEDGNKDFGQPHKSTISLGSARISAVEEDGADEDGALSDGEIAIIRDRRKQKATFGKKDTAKKANSWKDKSKKDQQQQGGHQQKSGSNAGGSGGQQKKATGDQQRRLRDGTLAYCKICNGKVGHFTDSCPKLDQMLNRNKISNVNPGQNTASPWGSASGNERAEV